MAIRSTDFQSTKIFLSQQIIFKDFSRITFIFKDFWGLEVAAFKFKDFQTFEFATFKLKNLQGRVGTT